MNQLRHVLGIPLVIPNGLASRGFTVSRSAGRSGRDLKTPGETFVAPSDNNDDSSEPKLTSKSYARLIADYSKAAEIQNAASKFDRETNIRRNNGLFSKSPFQSLARVSSLANVKNVAKSGSGLCTKSSSRPPLDSCKPNDKIDNSLADTQVQNHVAKRAEWLDHVVKTHNAKRMTENHSSSHDLYQRKAHHLVQGVPELNPTSNVKLTGNVSFGSIVKRLQGNSSVDDNLASKSSTTGNANSKGFNNWRERYCSSRKKLSGTSGCDGNNVSVTVQRLRETDKTHQELWMQNSGDGNAMLVTVTDESKLPLSTKSSPLKHIDLRINGKPATGVDTVINNKVDKLDVVSSAEKIEITIPVLSKNKGTLGDNARTANSTINLCISGQGKGCGGPNDVGYILRAGKAGNYVSGISKSVLTRPSTFMTSKLQNSRKAATSTCQSKVVPWWTTIESFRRSEASARADVATITRDQEVGDQKPKEVALSDTLKRSEFAVTKSTSPKQQESRKKYASVILSIIASETEKKSAKRQMSEQVSLTGSKSDVKPEAKADTKVRSSESNAPQKESPSVAITSTMPGKSGAVSTPTLDELPKKMVDSSGSTVAASGGKSTTVESEAGRANDFREKIRAKPISEVAKGNMSSGVGTTSDTRQVLRASDVKAGSKIGTKPQQEVIGKSETNVDAPPPQLPRTYGQIRLLPVLQSSTKPANHTNVNNNRCISVKPYNNNRTASDKFYKLKNPTITMRPIEKKKDGTLIDYGCTVNTRKKPQRKLSRSVSAADAVAAGLRGKKLMRQKENAVGATIKEVMPRRNRDTCSNATNPLGIEDNARSRLNGNNKRSTSEPRVFSNGSKRITSKARINNLNESNLKPSVKLKNQHSRDSDDARVNTPSADKKLVYSVWLRRFKDQTDPTSDPSTRNS